MLVKVTLLGEELALTKRERTMLQQASALLASIGRHTAGPESEAIGKASQTIETFLADEETESE